MKATEVPAEVVLHMDRLVRGYNGIVKEGTAAQLRARASGIDPKHDEVCQMLKQSQGKVSRLIGKELAYFDVWTEWMNRIPGVGPWIAGELISAFFYRHVPICKECQTPVEKREIEGVNTFYCPKCEKSVKGDGNLLHRMDIRTWKSISAWWAYCGRHVVDGKMPKRRKGQQSNWSTHLRTVTFHLGNSFVYQKPEHPYKAYLLNRKEYRTRTHPEATKMHRHRMAVNEAVKLFLSHFFIVNCELEGWDVPNPYAIQIQGHSGYIAPYYWGDESEPVGEDEWDNFDDEARVSL